MADLRHVLATATAGDVACLIAEPIQGVGGFTMPPDGLFAAYKEVLDERGILFISDEVQTGWGRTGEHFWGIGAHGVVPDMMTFAKGPANGFAIGGVIARADLMDGLQGNGISTFGGNPVATAAANATLDYLLDHDLQARAATAGPRIIGGLREAAGPLPAVGEVRGKGLMFAVDMVDPGTGHPARRWPPGCSRKPGSGGCSSARAGCTGTRCGWPRRSRSPMPRRRRGWRSSPARSRAVSAQATAEGASTVKHVAHWIGGKSSPGTSGTTGDIYDPATGQVTGTVDFASADEVDAAVSAAAEAAAGWRDASLARRSQVMFSFRELVRTHTDQLAALISSEHGKVASDAAGEVTRGLEVVEFACGIPHLLKGSYSENVSTRVDAYSIRQPLGVAAGITPFNFPAMVPMWMFPLAIACGNAFVLKPSEKDPSASVLLAELLAEAGLPDGVFNVVHGDAVAVNALLTHPGVAAVSFVGSTPIARHVYQTATAAGKRVQALGGAKNHMVVLADADLDNAADAAVSAGFGSAGERCMAVSVVVAVGTGGGRPGRQDRRAGGRPARRPRRRRTRRDGTAGHRPAPGPGRRLPRRGRARGRGAGRGRPRSPGQRRSGRFLAGSVGPRPRHAGHVRAMPMRFSARCSPWSGFRSHDAALDLVNANPYGNGVAVFTTEGGAARRFVNEVTVGMVGVNVPIPVPMAYYSFGGWKSSLFGDTHMHGTEGVHFYTRGKAVTSRWPEPGPGHGQPQVPREQLAAAA